MLAVEMNCHWVDVGAWPALESVIQADGDGNVSACSHVMHLGSRGAIVVSEEKHLIATIGVKDLVVVRTAEATLVLPRSRCQEVRRIVRALEAR